MGIDVIADLTVVRRVFLEYPKQLKNLKKELKIKELESNDLNHFIELADVDSKTLKDLVEELRLVYQKRREIKDNIKKMERMMAFIHSFGVKTVTLEKRIDKTINEVLSLQTNFDKRSYNIRVRHDLEWLLKYMNPEQTEPLEPKQLQLVENTSTK